MYFRDVRAADAGGVNPIVRIADSATRKIPGHDTVFGSTAPPSAAKGYMVFVGFDDEQNPTKGGVYRAPLVSDPTLQALVKIGDRVKDFKGETIHVPGTRTPYTFTRFGEGLSFDGRYVAFWAAWGPESRTIELNCPAEGNKAVVQYCMEHSLVVDGVYTGKYLETVPVNQGLFVYDTAKGKVAMAARSGAYFEDFLFWNYSGRPPGTGEGGDEGGEDTLRAAALAVQRLLCRERASVERDQLPARIQGGPARWRRRHLHGRRSGDEGEGLQGGGGYQDLGVGPRPGSSGRGRRRGDPAPGHLDGSRARLLPRRRTQGRRRSFLTINVGMANADASVTSAGVYVARMSNGR